MDVTPRKRTKIFTLFEHSEKSQGEIATIVGVSQRSVSRIIKQGVTTGSLSPKRKGNCGRKRKTTPRDDLFLIRQSKLAPQKTSHDLQKDLARAGVRVSSSTVRRRLLKVGRKAHRPVKNNFWQRKWRLNDCYGQTSIGTGQRKTGGKWCFQTKARGLFSFKDRGNNMSAALLVRNFAKVTSTKPSNTLKRCSRVVSVTMAWDLFVRSKEWWDLPNTSTW